MSLNSQLQVGVALAQHIGEGCYLLLATAHLTRLFKITFSPDITNDTLAIELLLEAAQGLVHGLTTANVYFNWHNRYK